jgi:hypothetical protein
MGIRRVGGFIFTYHIADHGNHVHISDGKKELCRFDIEKQEPIEKNFVIKKTGKLADALRKAGYLLE